MAAAAAVSLFLFLVLASFEILHSAAEEELFKKCPPFNCGNFTASGFLFSDSDKRRPGCGLFLIEGCDEKVQKIQLEKGGRWYTLEGIGQLEKQWENKTQRGWGGENIIIIHDDVLLQSSDCEFFFNLSLPYIPFISFHIHSGVDILNCSSKSPPNHNFLKDFIPSHRSCNNSSVYYRIRDGFDLNNKLNIPSSCSLMIDSPLKNLYQTKDLFTPFTDKLSIFVDIHPDFCGVCRKVGECPKICTKKRKGKLPLKLGLGFAVSAVVLTIMSILVIRLRAYEQNYGSSNLSGGGNVNLKKEDCNDIEVFLRGHGRLAPKRYSFKDIKKMTNKYKDKLGEGGFGTVYKGKLSNGCQVAVKVLNKAKDNGESFLNEVASISKTSHVNIVTLLGFCFEGHKRALIYEFMPNGSLEKFIHQENPLETNHLNWETLYQIAIGIARGLEYLHRGCNTRILHFDIKPHNILLDDNFCPKISDFGLAKLCPRKESTVSLTDPKGTIGYIAPEVFFRSIGRVSHKSDVYSYGMMVLEMVGERENVKTESDHSSEYFPQWIYKCLDLDENLGIWSIMNEDDKKIARKMIIVGLWCIQTNPSDRPPMCRVLEMLQGNLDSIEIPPKPFFSSPPRLPTEADVGSSNSLISSQMP